jgi:retinol dehydrogenase 13
MIKVIRMKNNGIKVGKYFKEYKVSNVLAMIKNNAKSPLICENDSRGKLVVITGATSGIGYSTAMKFASQGADLICINRNKEKSEALKHEIESTYAVSCDYILADLSSMEDTFDVAQKLLETDRSIDVLVHNAGIYLTKRQITRDGIEKVFMVNHLSSFIINYILKDKLKAQEKCRIILVNSEGHRFAAWGIRFDDLDWSKRHYSGLGSYGSAKLAQLLSMIRFDDFFRGSGVTINAMHPGAVKSATGQDNGRLYKWFKKNSLDKKLKPTSIAAEAIYYLGVCKDLEKTSGEFFNLTTQEKPTPPALDVESANILWETSIKLAKLDQ